LGFELSENKLKVSERDQDPPVKRYLGPSEPRLSIWERMVIAEDERVEVQKRDLKLLNDWLRGLRSRHVRVYKYAESSEARLEELKRRRQERRDKFLSDLAKGRRYLVSAFHKDNDRMLRESYAKTSKQLTKMRTTERKTPRVSFLGLSSSKMRKLISEGKKIEKATCNRNLQKEQKLSSTVSKPKKTEKINTFPHRQTKKDTKDTHMGGDEFKKEKEADSVKDIKSTRKIPAFRTNETRSVIGKKRHDEQIRTNALKGKSKKTAKHEEVLKTKFPGNLVPGKADIQGSVGIKHDSNIVKTAKSGKPSPDKKELVHRPVERKYHSNVAKAEYTVGQKETNLEDKRDADRTVISSSKEECEEKKLMEMDKVQDETGEKCLASKLEKQPSSELYENKFAIPSSFQVAETNQKELNELSEPIMDYPTPHESDEESIENFNYPEQTLIENNVSGKDEDSQTADEISEHEVSEDVSEHESAVDLTESKITEDISERKAAEDFSKHQITQNTINDYGAENISEPEAADNTSEEDEMIEDISGNEVSEGISEDYKNTEGNVVLRTLSEPGSTDESTDKNQAPKSIARENNVEMKQVLFKENKSDGKEACMVDEVTDNSHTTDESTETGEISKDVIDDSYDERSTKERKNSNGTRDDQTTNTEENAVNVKSEDSVDNENVSAREKPSQEYEDNELSEESKKKFSDATEIRDTNGTEKPLITETTTQHRKEQIVDAIEPSQNFRSEKNNVEEDYGIDKIYFESDKGEQLFNSYETSKTVEPELAANEIPTERQVPKEDEINSADSNEIIEFIRKEDLSTVEFSAASDEALNQDRDDQSIGSNCPYDSNENENYIDRQENVPIKGDNKIQQSDVLSQFSSDYGDAEETSVTERISPETSNTDLRELEQEENDFVQQNAKYKFSEDDTQE
ncbi:glutamic acid-rich protein-like, partial [Stegodyphus dumicola]|uniref:glutamic acid-rich protein-like n=1 Tax=Stegodyphus dumicola TaxID=202533 RepID=UPI0015B1DC32